MSHAQFLVDLDLSWNKLTTQSMLKIAEALSENRQLQYVNLSWNFLTKRAHADPDMDEDFNQAVEVINEKLENLGLVQKSVG